MIRLETSDKPIASLLILSQDNLQMLGDCLASVARTVSGVATPYEVLVLFQQTSRRSAELFLKNVRGVRALRARVNLGFGGGNNFAARQSVGKYLVFLNDDVITHQDWLEFLVRTAEDDDTIGAVGSRIIFPDGTLQEAGSLLWSDGSCYPLGRGEPPGSLAYSYVRDVDYASANGLLVRRSTFENAGGFDQRFFPGYYEDVDLCMTIRHDLTQRIVYEPRSIISHRESATSNRDPDFRAFLFGRHQAELCSKWASHLSSYPAPQPESKGAIERAVLRTRGNPKRVLVVDDRVPNAGLGSGFGRTADLLMDLSTAGFAVGFAASDRRHVLTENPLAALGVDIIAEPLPEHLHHLQQGYDVVIISRPHNFEAFYTAIRAALPHAKVVYDAEALYHRRLLLQAGRETDPSCREALDAAADRMQAVEEEIARSADRLIAISDSEVEWLESVDGHAPVTFMRPLGRDITMAPPNLSCRKDAVFVAGWLAGDESPNVDALRWYVHEVLPRVRSVLPDFVTFVSGGNPPLSVQSMAGNGICLVGFVESVEPLYRTARISIAPILAGAGVKIKTIEALQHGVPVVATAVGGEGLGLTDGVHIDVTDDPAEYANRLIALLSDDDLWMQRRENFTQILRTWESERQPWSEVVADALYADPLERTVTLC